MVDYTQRTKPKYPTYGPGDGRDWAQYFRDLRKPPPDDAVEEDPTPKVISPNVEVPLADLQARSTASIVGRRLDTQGWSVTAQEAILRVPAVLFKEDSDSHRAGDVRFPEHDVNRIVLIGTRSSAEGRILLVMQASWESKKGFCGAKTFDPVLGVEWRSGYRTPRQPNEIELEDGREPPASLEQWLDIFAPTAASRKRKEKAAAEKSEEGVWQG